MMVKKTLLTFNDYHFGYLAEEVASDANVSCMLYLYFSSHILVVMLCLIAVQR